MRGVSFNYIRSDVPGVLDRRAEGSEEEKGGWNTEPAVSSDDREGGKATNTSKVRWWVLL